MEKTIHSREQFQEMWCGRLNFLMSGECVPFSFRFPPLEQIVDEVRHDKNARIWRGSKGRSLDKIDIAQEFRAAPLSEAMRMAFQLSHFKLSAFYGARQILEGFEEQVMVPWRNFLTRAGFTWDRCYPIVFISGRNCATNYHLDVSYVLAWQIYGTKVFSGTKLPERWAPLVDMVQARLRDHVTKPAGLEEKDILAYEMTPGDVLWNHILTPHWVDATDEVACSINFSHGGLRHNGKLSPAEAQLEQWWAFHPEERWKLPY